ncbi:hypothetical protein [Streptobacillus canis]|uniref:hypothetical protein n=1 Tax=Streptobacillus canis TaxID=2678686 RepID=UPI0012E247EF|nr:hypothetical protein [Streptobacillus canis]
MKKIGNALEIIGFLMFFCTGGLGDNEMDNWFFLFIIGWIILSFGIMTLGSYWEEVLERIWK